MLFTPFSLIFLVVHANLGVFLIFNVAFTWCLNYVISLLTKLYWLPFATDNTFCLGVILLHQGFAPWEFILTGARCESLHIGHYR